MIALARRPAFLVGSSALGSLGGLYYFLDNTEQGRGVSRQAFFWRRMTPIIADYYWRTSSSSPYVKYIRKSTLAEELKMLHEKHAPEVFDVMLRLKGLYVKLGQVLSVTVLPLPETYRVLFRTLQSNVPGHEPFDVVRGVIERDLGAPLESIFDEFSETPLGAASIGQAHWARVGNQELVVKVQYPDAAWQVPADISCIKGLLRVCVRAGVVDEDAANLSFEEFSRQFLAELDYTQEVRNLEEIHRSSSRMDSPYQRHNVLVPKPFPSLCSPKIITMSFIPGPKLEEEARRQLKSLGVEMGSLRKMISGQADNEANKEDATSSLLTQVSTRWGSALLRWIGNSLGVDSVFWFARVVRGALNSSSDATVKILKTFSSALPLPLSTKDWIASAVAQYDQSRRVALTEEWITALFDVHGFQIFQEGLFNADPHPGNILVVDDKSGKTSSSSLGLIDFGQCKRLSFEERAAIGKLILAVANDRCDEEIAEAFRTLGVQTKNDSTSHLAKFAKLMFGPLRPHYMDREFHRKLHKEDRITYFPNSLSLVYRASMLLRGLSLSLQINTSVADMWKPHAEKALQNGLADADMRKPHAEKALQNGLPDERREPSATWERIPKLLP